ncbi:recombinase family protein [Mycobacterium sp. 21AC1]|uniref:recombinase family protein n=1 Tax=[Mycobacterium] appelbergii TaxID=2939269 RepID=UPI00293922EA|nr:recombinase family protein [Mycobacterium sp. 21AC1]MDV3130014.1 recombinase family protein [Mycobacterium sp. 21AC1]
MSTTKAAVYLRQSMDRYGDTLAVARQRKDCLALCEQRNWTPVEYVDNDRSATNGKARPKYQQMLADIAEGKIGAVVVWDLDRLHRQPRELEDFIELADAHRLALATVTGDCDLSTDNGRLYARIKGAVGKSETERKAARQRAAARQKAEQGRPQWKRAFGYVAGANGPEPDLEIAPLVKQAYAALLAGSSLNDIARLFNEAGAYGQRWMRPKDSQGNTVKDAAQQLIRTPWSATTVSLFLRKPRNAGLRAYTDTKTKGTEIIGKGTWPGLVDEAMWRAAQDKLNAPGRAPGRKSVRRHRLTGVLRCGKPGCGGYLSGQWVMQPTGGKPGRPKTGEKRCTSGQVAHSITYACKSCRGVSVRAEHVEPLLNDIVGGRLAMPDAIDLLKAEVHDEAEAEGIRLELETLYSELDKLAVERAEGLLTARQVKISTDIFAEKITKLERRQQDQERLRVFDGIALGTPEAAAAVKKLSPDRFRAVVDVLMAPTVMPVGKGGRVFDRQRLNTNWHE